MERHKYIKVIVILVSVFLFMCSPNTVSGEEKMETVYYYIVQPGDNLWKISEELYGYGDNWKSLYYNNQDIFDPSLIYPGMKLEVSGEQYMEERLLVQERKKSISAGFVKAMSTLIRKHQSGRSIRKKQRKKH